MWLGAPLAVAETYGLVMLALLAFSCWRIARREVPAPLAGREVAVLVATFNEPKDVLRPTVVGAMAIRNDVAPQVWVLDDGGRPWVRLMCEELGVRYLSRPPPRRHAKAGNINYALQHVEAEFIVTLDADHVPRPELLERMLGYFAEDGVAVVQAPQHFYNRGFQHPRDHDDPLRNEQSIFFDAVCRGKDRHNAAFWCGCPSIIRREALVSVGGVATDTVVEDAHTSMRLQAAGWQIVFHPEVMALGIAPEEIGAFLVQRGRWAKGSLQMLRHDPPMFKRGLTWSQRLEYTASCMHFLEGPQRLLGFLIPPIVLISGIAPIDAGPLLYAALFIPQILLVPLASRALTRGRYSLIEGERFAVARMTPYLKAMAALLGGRGGFQVTPKGGRARLVERGAGPVAADRPGVPDRRGDRLPDRRADPRPPRPAVAGRARDHRRVGRGQRRPGRLGRRLGTRHPPRALQPPLPRGRPGGLRRRPRPRQRPGAGRGHQPRGPRDERLDGAPGRRAPAGRAAARRRPDGGDGLRGSGPRRPRPGSWSVGVAFDDLEPAVADAIIEWCFRHPFGPERPVRVSELGPEPQFSRDAAPAQQPEPSRA